MAGPGPVIDKNLSLRSARLRPRRLIGWEQQRAALHIALLQLQRYRLQLFTVPVTFTGTGS